MCKIFNSICLIFIVFGVFSAGAGLLQWGGGQPQGAAACVTPYVAAPAKKACTDCWQKRGNPVWNQSQCQWEQAECTGNKPLAPRCAQDKGYVGEFDQSTCKWQRADNTTCKECARDDDDEPAKKACTDCWQTRGEPEWNAGRCRWEQAECTGSKPQKPSPTDCLKCYQTRGEPEWSDVECGWEQSLCTGRRPQMPSCASFGGGNYAGEMDSECSWLPATRDRCPTDGTVCSNNDTCEGNKICTNGQCVDPPDQDGCTLDESSNSCKINGEACTDCSGGRERDDVTCQCVCPDGKVFSGTTCIAQGERTCGDRQNGVLQFIGHACNRESNRVLPASDTTPGKFGNRCKTNGRCEDVTRLTGGEFVTATLRESLRQNRLFCDSQNNLKKRNCVYNRYSTGRLIQNLAQCPEAEDLGIQSRAICENCAVRYHSCIEECQTAHESGPNNANCTLVRPTTPAVRIGNHPDTTACREHRKTINEGILSGMNVPLAHVHARDCTSVCKKKHLPSNSNCTLSQGMFNCPDERPYLKAIGQCVQCVSDSHCPAVGGQAKMCSNNTCVAASAFNTCKNRCLTCGNGVCPLTSSMSTAQRNTCRASRHSQCMSGFQNPTAGCSAFCDWQLNDSTCSNTICTAPKTPDPSDFCKCKDPADIGSPGLTGNDEPPTANNPPANPPANPLAYCQSLTGTARTNCERAVRGGKAPLGAACLNLPPAERASCWQRILQGIQIPPL